MATESLRKTLFWGGLAVFAIGLIILFTEPSLRLLGIILGVVGLTPAIVAIPRIWEQMRWARR